MAAGVTRFPPPNIPAFGGTLGIGDIPENCRPPGVGPFLGLPPPWGTAAPPQAWNHPWDCLPWGSAPPRWVWGHPGELQPPRFGDDPGIGDTLGSCSPLPGMGLSLGLPPPGTCSPSRIGAIPRISPGDLLPSPGLVPTADSGCPWGSVPPPRPGASLGIGVSRDLRPLRPPGNPGPLLCLPGGGCRGAGAPAPTPLRSSGGAVAAARAFGVSWCGRGPAGRGARSLVPPWASRC